MTKCNLDQIGSLVIWRKDQFKIALCPYSHAGANYSGEHNVLGFGPRPCGDWCPKLLERRRLGMKIIEICDKTIYKLENDFRIPKEIL